MSESYIEIVQNAEILPYAELYDFIFPLEETVLCYTNYPQYLSYHEKLYQPAGIQRSFIKQEKMEDITVTISIYTKEGITYEFLNQDVPKIKIIIRKFFFTNSAVKTIFVGEGTFIGIHDRILTFEAKDILSKAVSKTVPKFLYSAYCCHSLFDKNCGLNKEDYKVVTTITIKDNGKTLSSDSFASFPDNYFTNGYVQYGNIFRLIVAHSGDTITLHYPISNLENGNTVVVYPGCNKTPSDCKNKFNNYSNFLGFPYIPTKNPTIFGFT